MYIADLLSRSFEETIKDFEEETDLNEIVHSINMSRSKEEEFKFETDSDEVLKEIKRLDREGWPSNKNSVPERLKAYYKLRNEIYVEEGLVFHGDRLIVPKKMRRAMLDLIHEGHQGILKCKLRARSLLFWPGINNDIENMVLSCKICEKFRESNKKETLIPHEVPSRPFQYICTDICEHGNKEFLIVIDKYSKWLEVLKVKNKQSSELIGKFKLLFATHGIPETQIMFHSRR